VQLPCQVEVLLIPHFASQITRGSSVFDLFTNWKEMMKRFNEKTAAAGK